MLSYVTETHNGKIFSAWVAVHEISGIFVRLTDLCDFLDFTVDEAIPLIAPHNIVPWSRLLLGLPPKIYFSDDERFLNWSGMYEISTPKNAETITWIDNLLFKPTVNREEFEASTIFVELKKLFDFDDKTENVSGQGRQLHPTDILKIVARMESSTVKWIKSLLNLILTIDYDRVHTIFEIYNPKLADYTASLAVLGFIMFCFGKFTLPFSNPMRRERNAKLISIIKYKHPDTSPVYALTMKYFTSNVKFKKIDRASCIEQQLKSISFMTKYESHNEPNLSRLIRLGDASSLEIDNAGPMLRRKQDAIASHTQLFLELANRDYTERSGLFTKIVPKYE